VRSRDEHRRADDSAASRVASRSTVTGSDYPNLRFNPDQTEGVAAEEILAYAPSKERLRRWRGNSGYDDGVIAMSAGQASDSMDF